jgi:hypothetical protein
MPLSQNGVWEQLIHDLLFNLILLSGVFAVFSFKWQRYVFVSMALFAFFIRWMVFLFPDVSIKIVDSIASLLYFTLLITFVLRYIFKEGPVNSYRIQGALVVYLIFGIMCAYVYNLLHLTNPGSFSFQFEQTSATFFSKFLYFSFVIQTTLGIGDIAPVHPLAKSLVIFQAMMGMLYPVIMIARLVSLEIEHSRESRKGNKL